MLVHDLKKRLLTYHQAAGFELHPSFPLVTKDPTVLFTNASITPFKARYLSLAQPPSYSLLQRCLRSGGAASLELVGAHDFYFSLFEMFGSGLFGVDHKTAVRYLLDVLDLVGLERERLQLIIPPDERFQSSLAGVGIAREQTHTLTANAHFWQSWRFGQGSLVGSGLTVVYNFSANPHPTIADMSADERCYVELLNLIAIETAEAPDGSIYQLPRLGFDFGAGIERLASVLQRCSPYEIDTIKPLVRCVEQYGPQLGPHECCLIADHLRSISVLATEGLQPSNKLHGYVLRKLIRRFLEHWWKAAGTILETNNLLRSYVTTLGQVGFSDCSYEPINSAIEQEAFLLRVAIQQARRYLGRHPGTEPKWLYDMSSTPFLIHRVGGG